MSDIRIKDLKAGQLIDSVFIVASIEIRSKKNGGNFFTIKLSDSTGSVGAVAWDSIDLFESGEIKPDDYVRITGDVNLYQDVLQIVIKGVKKVDFREINPADFLPHTSKDIGEMIEELHNYISNIKQPFIKNLVEIIFSDEEVINGVSNAPAAASMHQAYIGGLLEHTLAVLKNALTIAGNYPQTDVDLLTAGVLLHDIGKIYEYQWTPKICYSDQGRLIGHISIGTQMLEKYTSRIDNFPQNLKTILTHLIVSHHGTLEWGSPRRPATLEAFILHYADNIDAKSSTYIEETQRSKERGEDWTGYLKMFDGSLFVGYDDLYEPTPNPKEPTLKTRKAVNEIGEEYSEKPKPAQTDIFTF